MERRKILLGSGSIIAIALAGCTNVSSDQEAGTDGNSESNGQDETDDGGEKKDSRKDNGNNDNTENDENDQHQDENHEHQDIPGFDREAFKIDSEVIQVKKLSYQDHKLDIRVMITTTDRDVLAEELRALAPGFECAMRDGDVEEFFAEVEQIQFTLYDEAKNIVFAIYVDLRWVREFLDGEMTNDEFANRCLEQIDQE